MLNEMVSIVGPAPLIVAMGLLATLLIGSVFLALSYREQSVPAAHTLDCLDWRRRGERDTTCPAHHGTDWFAPIEQETP